jgi:hypothetical protein
MVDVGGDRSAGNPLEIGMMTSPVIALVDDLMTVSRLDSAARASGVSITFPSDEAELVEAIKRAQGGAALLLVGLAATKLPWQTLVPTGQSVANTEGVNLRVIAFGPHMDLELRQQAKDAGIGEVWANSRLMTDLPKLLEDRRT